MASVDRNISKSRCATFDQVFWQALWGFVGSKQEAPSGLVGMTGSLSGQSLLVQLCNNRPNFNHLFRVADSCLSRFQGFGHWLHYIQLTADYTIVLSFDPIVYRRISLVPRVPRSLGTRLTKEYVVTPPLPWYTGSGCFVTAVTAVHIGDFMKYVLIVSVSQQLYTYL